MAQLYLQNRPTFASGLAQTMEAMGGLQANQARSALMRQQLQEHQDLKKAMVGYTQTGDIAPVMVINPEVGMHLQKNVMEMHKQKRTEDIATLDKTIDTVEKYLPALKGGDFKQYGVLRDKMQGIFGEGIDAVMPPGFKSQGDFQTWIDNFHKNYLNIKTANEQVKAQISREKLNTITPFQQTKIDQGKTRLGIEEGKAGEAARHHRALEDKAGKPKEKSTKEILYGQYQSALDRVNAMPEGEEKQDQMKKLQADALRRGVISKGSIREED